MKQLAQHRAGAVVFRGGLKGVLDLPEDLRLADDDRIETGGHAEQVPDGSLVVVREQMRREGRRRQVVILAQERRHFLARPRRIVADDVDLRPVARRQHDRLGRGRPQRERLDGRAEVATREVEPLTQLDGRSPMTYTEEDDLHLTTLAI